MSSKGCLIAANNSQTVDGQLLDYCSLAKISARFVGKFLNIPVTFVTSQPENFNDNENVIVLPLPKASSRTIFSNNDRITYKWFNDMRIDMYELTPYDRTLMIDADYIVKTNKLNDWLESDIAFHIFDTVYDVTDRNIYANQEYLPNKSIKQMWATAIVWDKNAYPIFETARMVKNSYEYYALLARMPRDVFRNDLAFSIACHLLNYKTNNFNNILYNLPTDSRINHISDNSFKIVFDKANPSLTMWYNDIHVINKDLILNKELMDNLKHYVESI